MKKILIIGLTEKMGGVETFIYNTTRFSNKSKYEYDFLIHGTRNAVFQDKIEKFYGSKSHFFFVPSFKKSPLKSFRQLSKFYKENGDRYDYVHLETGATSEIVYVFPFTLKYNFKVITHSHNGNGYSPIINSFFRPLLNKISNQKLSCSKEATYWLFGKRREKEVRVINNGIDTKRFTYSKVSRENIRSRYGINEDEVVIGHIGRFSEQKNHKFLLNIFSEVNKKNRKVVLMLVGVGELLESVRQQAEELKISDRVFFCGLQTKTEEYYSAFDLFIMPSLYEGLPIVGIEAQCEGLPCFFSSNISRQIKITDKVRIMDLDKGPSVWATNILNSFVRSSDNRRVYTGEVEKQGYSIQETIHTLEEVYGV